MQTISTRLSNLFAPKPPTEFTFETAAHACKMQRIARITKTAFFALATLSTMAALSLSDLSVITWPVTLTLIGITIVALGTFFALNRLDKKYTKELSDDKRSSLVTNEIENIFHGKRRRSDQEIKKSLTQINCILGTTVFTKRMTENLLKVNALSTQPEHQTKSLNEIALEHTIPIIFSCSCAWKEKGRFGLPTCDYKFEISWSHIPGETKVTYSCIEEKKDEEAVKEQTKKEDIAKPKDEKVVNEGNVAVVETMNLSVNS